MSQAGDHNLELRAEDYAGNLWLQLGSNSTLSRFGFGECLGLNLNGLLCSDEVDGLLYSHEVMNVLALARSLPCGPVVGIFLASRDCATQERPYNSPKPKRAKRIKQAKPAGRRGE